MKHTSKASYSREQISFDVSDMSKTELRQMFGDLNVSSLRHWMQHYIHAEKYEVCQVIKEILDDRKVPTTL